MRASCCGNATTVSPSRSSSWASLPEPPRVVDEFAHVVLAGEVAHEFDGFEYARVAVKDVRADVQLFVDPDDGGCGAFAADIDTDPDVFAVVEVRLADAGLPGAGGEPGAFADAPAAGVELRESSVRNSAALTT